jgi:hypothetical protein
MPATRASARLFEATAPADDVDSAAPVAAAINVAFGKAAADLVVWALTTVSDAEGGGTAEAPPMDAPSEKMPDGDAGQPAPADAAPADTAPADAAPADAAPKP